MPSLGEVMTRHGEAYLRQYAERILPSHRRAIQAIRQCRTEALGGHVYRCAHCEKNVYSYHSCKNRHGPSCHQKQTETWITKRQTELLPVPYYHVVFTVPRELHTYARSHQKIVYGALMRCAARALMKLCRDAKYVGGEIGVMTVLHTWTRDLGYHPHVHCLVTGGGLAADGQTWHRARQGFLVPVRALSIIFRGMLRDELRQKLSDDPFPANAFRQRKWVVFAQHTGSAQTVLEYLARYVHRIAITDRNILRVTDQAVVFRYQDNQQHQWHTMALPPNKFLHRFLQHVLPQGFQKVRYFGLWHSSKKNVRARLRMFLPPLKPPTAEPVLAIESESEPKTETRSCPYCKQGPLIHLREIRRQRKPP